MSVVNITDAAKEQIINLCKSNNKNLIKFGVNSGGCSGFSYSMDFAETVEDDDEIIMLAEGVSLAVDGASLMYIIGTEIDYKNDIMGSTFAFSNPNQANSCGCNKSFSV